MASELFSAAVVFFARPQQEERRRFLELGCEALDEQLEETAKEILHFSLL
jgi:hypothetical protein